MSDQFTCGQALVKLLEKYGVDTVFGIPGVHTLEMYRGLANSNIRHVQTRHEQGAGFMADGYARVSGDPGVAMLISGPGVTNAATALGQAYNDSIPLLLISSDTASYTHGKGWGALHEVTDLHAVTRPLTALSAAVNSPEDLPELIGQAWAIFESKRPRPVHISIPIDVLEKATDGNWERRTPPARPMPDPASVQNAVELLSRAERPLILLGGGAIGAQGTVTELAELLQAGVIASNAGKGIVPDSHPLSLGGSISRRATLAYLSQADVVLAIGTELSETDSFIEKIDMRGKLIRVDIDPGKINDLYPADIGIVADAAAMVTALCKALQAAGHASMNSQLDELARTRAQIEAEFSPIEQQHDQLLQALREAVSPETVVMGDISQIVYTGSAAFAVEQPRKWYYPAGYCTLGPALPMAIGAKLALPAQPLVAISGDGGFMFTVQEMATAVQEKLTFPIVLWENGGLGQIRDDMKQRDIPPTGVDMLNPDFVKLADAFGARGIRPSDRQSFQDAVVESFSAEVPTLIEVSEGSDWLL